MLSISFSNRPPHKLLAIFKVSLVLFVFAEVVKLAAGGEPDALAGGHVLEDCLYHGVSAAGRTGAGRYGLMPQGQIIT